MVGLLAHGLQIGLVKHPDVVGATDGHAVYEFPRVAALLE
jgi:hypothetical protein